MGAPTKYDLSQIFRTVAEIRVWKRKISIIAAVLEALEHIDKLSNPHLTSTKRNQLIASVMKKYSQIGPTLESKIKARGRFPPWPIVPTLLTVQAPEVGPKQRLVAEFREL